MIGWDPERSRRALGWASDGLVERVVSICLDLPGWATAAKIRRMHELALQSAGRHLPSVELGVFGGRTLIPMAFAHASLGASLAIGVDPWDNVAPLEGQNSPENDEWWATVDLDAVLGTLEDCVRRHSLSKYCRFLRTRSQEAAIEGPIGLLHQDSNHSEKVSREEVRLYAPRIAPGGYWVSDDTDWSTTQAANRDLVEEYGFTVLEEHKGWRVYRK